MPEDEPSRRRENGRRTAVRGHRLDAPVGRRPGDRARVGCDAQRRGDPTSTSRNSQNRPRARPIMVSTGTTRRTLSGHDAMENERRNGANALRTRLAPSARCFGERCAGSANQFAAPRYRRSIRQNDAQTERTAAEPTERGGRRRERTAGREKDAQYGDNCGRTGSPNSDLGRRIERASASTTPRLGLVLRCREESH
jgi:hypothetical protein